MAATTDSNLLYVRYSDTPGITTTQPASTPGTPDPGAGWETKVYLNFNGDYVRHDEDNNVAPAPQPYVRHDENNLPVAVDPYQRHDDDNNPV